MSLNSIRTKQFQKHESLYFDDGNLVIRINGSPILFNLLRSRCRRASALIAKLVPATPPSPGEPSSAESNPNMESVAAGDQDHFQEATQGTLSNPLKLSLAFEEFELAAGWMIGELKRPISVQQWLLLLEAADYLEIETLRTEAIEELSVHICKAVPPAQTISLARRFCIDPWLQPGLAGFLSFPPSALTEVDLQYAGEDTVLSYIRLLQRTSTFRTALVLYPPPFTHDTSCFDDVQRRCKAAFSHWWHSQISTLLLEHRTREESPNITYKRLKSRLEIASYAALAAIDDPDFKSNVIAGMTRQCQSNGLQQCLNNPALAKEEEALQQTIEDLVVKEKGEAVGNGVDSEGPDMSMDTSPVCN